MMTEHQKDVLELAREQLDAERAAHEVTKRRVEELAEQVVSDAIALVQMTEERDEARAHCETFDHIVHELDNAEQDRDAALGVLRELVEADTAVREASFAGEQEQRSAGRRFNAATKATRALLKERSRLVPATNGSETAHPGEDMKIPTWLLDLSKQLKTQDNRSTGNPIFLVQQKQRIYGFDPEYGQEDDFEWLHEDEGYGPDEYVQLALDAYYEATGNEPEGYRRLAYMDTWEFVQCFFINQDAEEYIRMNKHRLNEPRVYVESGYRNLEWIALRGYLMGLTDETRHICANCDSFARDRHGTFCRKYSWQKESGVSDDSVPEDGQGTCHHWSLRVPVTSTEPGSPSADSSTLAPGACS